MKLKNLLLTLLIAFCAISFIQAQTVMGTGGAVPASGNYTVFSLPVSGISPAVMDASYGITGVCIDLIHPNLTEVSVSLVSPSGQVVELVNNNPAGGANYVNTCFDASASTSINSGTAPFTGSFRPTGYIGMLNDGSNPNGTWQLQVKIWNVLGSAGTLNGWNLTFGANPLTPVVLTSSNLPIVKINTGGQVIVDEIKKTMNMSITYNGIGVRNNMTDPPNNYNGIVRVEYRGSSSLNFQKKSISLETVDASGRDLDVSLVGMPQEHDWILYASYIDKSLIRNTLTYELASSMGNYASRSQFVEVIIDGIYQGVYVLQEKIKRGKDRVDISKLSTLDNSGDALTGGYIVRIDKTDGTDGGWKSKVGPASGTTDTVFFQYYYPKDTVITLPQQAYIQNYVNSFEQVMMSADFANPTTGYYKYIDVNSFVDYFILCELSKNVDAYKVSAYLYKDKDSKGGKLKLGPIWDLDLAYGNANYATGWDPVGWEYVISSTPYEIPRWWERLMLDPNFLNRVNCRWQQLKTNSIITPATLHAKVDSLTTYLSESQARNFQRWPIIDANVWTNPAPVPATYAAHAIELKNWISSRYNWLNTSMPGAAINCFLAADAKPSREFELSVYPNPFKQQTTFSFYLSEATDVTLVVYDILGKQVNTMVNKTKIIGERQMTFNAENLNSGVYFYKLITGTKYSSGRMIIQK